MKVTAGELLGVTLAAVAIVVVVLVAIWVYMLPAWVARKRGHPHCLAIERVNLFLGWTTVMWIGCMIWAVMPFEVSLTTTLSTVTRYLPTGTPPTRKWGSL